MEKGETGNWETHRGTGRQRSEPEQGKHARQQDGRAGRGEGHPRAATSRGLGWIGDVLSRIDDAKPHAVGATRPAYSSDREARRVQWRRVGQRRRGEGRGPKEPDWAEGGLVQQ